MTYDEFKELHSGQMPKGRKPMAHPEDDIQKACVKWFKEEGYPQLAPLLFHPNNEPYFGAGKTKEQKERAGARAKAMGVTAGVADLILMYPGYASHGLCIEMKNKTGRQSDAQKEWQKAVEQMGYRYELCRSFEQFKIIVADHIGVPPQDPEQAAVRRIFGPGFKAKLRK